MKNPLVCSETGGFLFVLGAIGEKTTRIIRKRFAIQRNERIRAENAGIPAVLARFQTIRTHSLLFAK